ncbi:hypothetical protein [Aurantiacibacter gangjinensis]|uniref:hypothetical protein n=2 Tax=Aurantiacibacter gangjinensis TaxID=502682 RepID=UPI0019D3F061|nr:hypothetical protein [Aurantiacibacter gangjinensis]
MATAQDQGPPGNTSSDPMEEAFASTQMTEEQSATYASWPPDMQALYDAWSADQQGYYWTLPPERAELFWRLSTEDRMSLMRMDDTTRERAWTMIEAQAASQAPEGETVEPDDIPEPPDPEGL